ncbi:uncharacterized protein LOC135219499 isoform X1 [Macrobrachium nipponense]|uniref:uncharacterized protein LOC135219499 isoform X1 n=1 Tax=Macrobrachium nipponense TaxID=159736 RepID=UPI0030C8A17A
MNVSLTTSAKYAARGTNCNQQHHDWFKGCPARIEKIWKMKDIPPPPTRPRERKPCHPGDLQSTPDSIQERICLLYHKPLKLPSPNLLNPGAITPTPHLLYYHIPAPQPSSTPEFIPPTLQGVPPTPQVFPPTPQIVSPTPQVVPPTPQVFPSTPQIVPPTPQVVPPTPAPLSIPALRVETGTQTEEFPVQEMDEDMQTEEPLYSETATQTEELPSQRIDEQIHVRIRSMVRLPGTIEIDIDDGILIARNVFLTTTELEALLIKTVKAARKSFSTTLAKEIYTESMKYEIDIHDYVYEEEYPYLHES